MKNEAITIRGIDELDEGILLKCNRIQMSQVFLNLFSNSIDAMKKLNNKWIKIKIIKNNDLIKIMIIDAGKGISLEQQKKLFIPFYTTKPIGEGTGLGLGIIKGIVNSHGGRIFFDGESENTNFIIEIKSNF